MTGLNVLLLGGSGQLGCELARVYGDCQVYAPSHSEMPIENLVSVAETLDQRSVDLVFNCTAFHQVQECEEQPEKAFAINAILVGKLAKECSARNIPFVTVSTDYVFSGDESAAYGEYDRAAPKNTYGISKLAGEHLAFCANSNTFVFRVSGLFGRSGFSNKGPSFIERMLRLAECGEKIEVVDNLVFSPSYAVHVADAIRPIVERGNAGIYHVTNTGQCSWYELAVEAIKQAGLDAQVVAKQFVQEREKLHRPLYSPLRHDAIEKWGFDKMPSWQTAVSDYLRVRKARNARLA